MNLKAIRLIALILCQLFFLNQSEGEENANIKKIQEELNAAGVKNTLLQGLGFGIEDTGNAQLNQIAKRMQERFKVAIILDPDPNKSPGTHYSEQNIIRISVTPENIKDLLSWKDSPIRTTLFHEIRHTFLEDTFDRPGKITPLSGALFGKKSDDLDKILNPYFSSLSFQEYSTFAQDMKLLSASENGVLKNKSALFQSSTIFENFAHDTSQALEEIESHLNSETTKLIDKTEEIRGSKIRYLTIQTPNWDLDLQIPESTLLHKKDDMVNLAKERITSMKSIVQSMRANNQEIRKWLGEKNPDSQKVKDLININQRIAKRSYRPFSTQCENYFSNLFTTENLR